MHQRTGTANLPLHGGQVPLWLSTRMAALGRVLAEAIVQQGMNDKLGEARRYHWQSEGLIGFFESPHAAIESCNVGDIINLADIRAERNRAAGLELVRSGPDPTISVLRRFWHAGNLALS